MKLIFKYAKPFVLMVIAAVFMLLCQTVCELYLPNFMSKIVNVGIVQSGVDDPVPEVMSERAFRMVSGLMDEDSRSLMEDSYTLAQAGTASAKLRRTFKGLGNSAAYVLSEKDKTKIAQLKGAYDKAMLTFNMCVGEQSFAAMPSDELYALADGVDPAAFAAAGAMLEDMNAGMAGSVGSVFTQAFYKEMGASMGPIQQGYILRIGAIMLLFSLISGGANVMTGFFGARVSAGIGRTLRRDVYRRVTNFSAEDIDKFSTATLITRSTNDVQQVQMVTMMGVRMILMAPLYGVGGTIMALRKSVNMSWIIALAVVLLMSLQVVMFKLVVPRFKRMQKLTDRLNLVARESLTGMLVIRAFGNEGVEEKRFNKANSDIAQNHLSIERTMATLSPIENFMMSGVTLLIIWVAGHAVARFDMPIGDMLAYMQYVMQIIMAFMMIAQMFIFIPRALVSATRVQEILDTEPTIMDRGNTRSLGHRAEGHIVFDHVSFKYGDAEKCVLEDISFEVKPGQTVAFIGATGSGKSTLINLIPRFYDVTAGSISLDGVDIRDLPVHELRDNIGYVPQKALLFSGDVATNMSLGKMNATDDEMFEAIERAQAGDFITREGSGLDTAIAQGGDNVSGGQKQRLSIARALLKNPPIYIFDDSFSALDFRTDAKLRKALYETTDNATVLIVAQRVSTIMNADLILVLDEGHVIGMGTHDELMKSCEAYVEIAESQLSKEELA